VAPFVIKRVLCATALDDSGDLALREADRYARRHGAELIVLHALPTFPGVPMFPAEVTQQMIDRERLAAEVIDAVLGRASSLIGRKPEEIGVAVEDGPAYAAILRKAEEIAADLVVVGASGQRSVLLGGIAERVVRYAHASVLVVRESPASGRVLVGTDFSPLAERAVAAAHEEARRRDGSLVVVHALETAALTVGVGVPPGVPIAAGAGVPIGVFPFDELRRVAEDRLRQVAGALQPPAEARVVDESPTRAIPSLAAELGAELVVVGTAGHTGLARVLLGSVAEAVTKDAPCSVLAVR
jgi:nucleotide-binding universal stress UspA family protein